MRDYSKIEAWILADDLHFLYIALGFWLALCLRALRCLLFELNCSG
jgi:hypothetical protein